MKAIILAGGLGTRIRGAISEALPKPMAPVNGKPFLEYVLQHLTQHKVNQIILAVGYKYERIQDYFGSSFGQAEISYSVETEPLGTGGAISVALDLIAEADTPVLVLNGDTYFPIDYGSLLEQHIQKKAGISLALKFLEDNSRYGSVKLDNQDRVVAFTEKQAAGQGLINGGVYLIERNIFQNQVLPDKFSFEEFLANKVTDLPLAGIVFDSYFRDMGIPEDYQKLQNELSAQL